MVYQNIMLFTGYVWGVSYVLYHQKDDDTFLYHRFIFWGRSWLYSIYFVPYGVQFYEAVETKLRDCALIMVQVVSRPQPSLPIERKSTIAKWIAWKAFQRAAVCTLQQHVSAVLYSAQAMKGIDLSTSRGDRLMCFSSCRFQLNGLNTSNWLIGNNLRDK